MDSLRERKRRGRVRLIKDLLVLSIHAVSVCRQHKWDVLLRVRRM